MSENGTDEGYYLDELESLRNAPLEIILANPAAKIIYDLGFKMGQGLKEVQDMESKNSNGFLKEGSPKKSMTEGEELPKDMEEDVEPESTMDDDEKFHSDVEADELDMEVEKVPIETKADVQVYEFKDDSEEEKEKVKEEEKEEDKEEEKEEEKKEDKEEEKKGDDEEEETKGDLDSSVESDRMQIAIEEAAAMDGKTPPRDD